MRQKKESLLMAIGYQKTEKNLVAIFYFIELIEVIYYRETADGRYPIFPPRKWGNAPHDRLDKLLTNF